MKIIKKRTEFVTKGADPTVIVKWVLYDGGTVSAQTATIELEEFQNVYHGHILANYKKTNLHPMVAQALHEALENEHGLEERERERQEEGPDDRWAHEREGGR